MAKKEEATQKLEAVPGQVIPEVYTNAAMVNFSPYEFEITNGLASSNYQGIRPVVNVRMSPQFAKEYAKVLADNIKLFEERFGAIKIDIPERNQ